MITSHKMGRIYLEHTTASAGPRSRRRRPARVGAPTWIGLALAATYFISRML